ncbi:MAG TPA: PEP-CTERM sorting domain-containing protein [Terriglobales bacterium]|nr:PEP-CTERM sorting domain-containing protein [Terriglobales bacterium]
MRKCAGLLFVAVLALCSTAAFADPTQITLFGTPGSVSITSTGAPGQNQVAILFDSIGGVANNAVWQYNYVAQSLGTFSIAPSVIPMIATMNPSGSWDINTQGDYMPFTFTANDGNSLNSFLFLTSMTDGSSSPTFTFNGTFLINASSGSALFTSLYPAGALVHFDLTFSRGSGPSPSDIALGAAGTGYTFGNPEQQNSGAVSSGEVLTSHVEVQPVPEPAGLALLGCGFGCVAGLLRRRKK